MKIISTSTAVTLVGSLGTTFGDTLVSILPVIFGVLIVAAAIFWVFNLLMGFFRRGKKA